MFDDFLTYLTFRAFLFFYSYLIIKTMNFRKLLSIVLIAITIIGCKNHRSKEYFISPVNNKKDILFDKIKLDSIPIKRIESSYVGFIRIVSNSIYFIDQRFGWIFEFDKNGLFQRRYLGVGRGPEELNTKLIDGYLNLRDGRHIFIGAGNDCHIYKNNFIKDKSFMMDKRYKRAKLGKSEYRPDLPEIYTLAYEKLVLRNFGNDLFFTVVAEHPSFNFIRTPKKYFEECRIIMKMNLNNGATEGLLGRYSPVYMANDNFKQISLTSFDIDNNGMFYVQQEADSLIYVYNQDFIIEKSFGFRGKDMDMPSRILATIDDFRMHYKEERQDKGYYDWIEYIDETGVLFRSYKKGKNSNSDGLQAYKNDVLIADFVVPKNFKVTGYISPYYYSNEYINEDTEKMIIYKFKL